MIKHIWSIICKESITNQDDNLISLIGLLEELNSVITPLNGKYKKGDKLAIPFNFELINFWIKDQEKGIKLNIKIEIIDPTSKIIATSTNSSIFPAKNKRLRTRMKIQGLPVTENGRYNFRVSYSEGEGSKSVIVSELPLDVKFEVKLPNLPN